MKDVLAALISYILAPFNAVTKFFGYNLTDKALGMLGLKKPAGAGEGDKKMEPISEGGAAASEDKIQPVEPSGAGAQVNAYQADTEQTKADIADANQAAVVAPGGGGGTTVTCTSTQ